MPAKKAASKKTATAVKKPAAAKKSAAANKAAAANKPAAAKEAATAANKPAAANKAAAANKPAAAANKPAAAKEAATAANKPAAAKEAATAANKAPNVKDWMSAVVRGQVTVVRAGIEAGIDCNVFVDDELPIVKAIEAGNLKVISTLLAAGARVDLTDEYGMTPLHHAALRTEKVDVVKALVDAGSNPNAKSTKDHDMWAGGDRGMTPLDMARARRDPQNKITAYLAAL